MSGSASEIRYAEIAHETAHARVQVVLDLDGGTRRDLATGVGT
ncbi:MAG: imidazoleglycerol-phosphate dehydratase, partial [Fimbriimonadaceae bacterium]|nr:imidazoleglycerol-phosphate dehydratase [Fimbriimonadaceae bacterium]